jgi:hypothetical protein
MLFRSDSTDERKNRSDVNWASAFVTLFQLIQITSLVIGGLTFFDVRHISIECELAYIFLFFCLHFTNALFVYSPAKAQVILDSYDQLSENKKNVKRVLAILIIAATIAFLAVMFTIHFNSINNITPDYEPN